MGAKTTSQTKASHKPHAARCAAGRGEKGAFSQTKAPVLAARSFFNKVSTPQPVEALDLNAFLALELPKQTPILGKWLLRQSLAMIYSERGGGKTFLGTWAAHAVATGQPLYGWKVERPCKVLYLDGEMAAPSLQRRLRKIVRSTGISPRPGMLRIVTPDLQKGLLPDLSTPEGQDYINCALDPDADVIIVDNLSSWSKSGREDAESWAPIAEWALRMRAEGRAVVFIHHSGKAGTQRGTSRREDLLDTVIALRRPVGVQPSEGACFEVHFEKSRHLTGADIAPFRAHLTTNDKGKQAWEWEPVVTSEEKQLQEVLVLHKRGLSQAQIAKKLGVDRSTVCRRLQKAGERK